MALHGTEEMVDCNTDRNVASVAVGGEEIHNQRGGRKHAYAVDGGHPFGSYGLLLQGGRQEWKVTVVVIDIAVG